MYKSPVSFPDQQSGFITQILFRNPANVVLTENFRVHAMQRRGRVFIGLENNALHHLSSALLISDLRFPAFHFFLPVFLPISASGKGLFIESGNLLPSCLFKSLRCILATVFSSGTVKNDLPATSVNKSKVFFLLPLCLLLSFIERLEAALTLWFITIAPFLRTNTFASIPLRISVKTGPLAGYFLRSMAASLLSGFPGFLLNIKKVTVRMYKNPSRVLRCGTSFFIPRRRQS